MARSRKQRDRRSSLRNRNLDVSNDPQDDDDGTLSTLSTVSEATLLTDADALAHPEVLKPHYDIIVDKIKNHAQHLAEQRPSIRIAAAEAIWRALTHTFIPTDELDGVVETIVEGLLKGGIRKGGVMEVRTTCRTLGALWITVGNDPALCCWNRAKSALMKLKKYGSVMECLALGYFLLEEEPDDVENFLNLLEYSVVHYSSTARDLLLACLKGWLLLATTLDSRVVVKRVAQGSTSIGRALVALATADGTSSDVRVAAAEVLAYILECDTEGSLADDGSSDENAESGIDMITGALRAIELSDKGNVRTAKSDRQWRKQLNEAALNNGKQAQSIKIGPFTLQATGLGEIKRLEAFRSMLKGGITVHVRDNPILKEIFAIEVNDEFTLADHRANTAFRANIRSDQKKKRNVQLHKRRQTHYAELEVLTVGDSD